MQALTKPLSIIGSALGLGSTAAPTIKTAAPVNQDQSIDMADEQLRKRSRQGVNANILSGPGGDSSTNSTGQKTLLGG